MASRDLCSVVAGLPSCQWTKTTWKNHCMFTIVPWVQNGWTMQGSISELMRSLPSSLCAQSCSLQAGGPFPSRKGITTGSGAQSGHLKQFNYVQLVRCSRLLSIPPARPFQIYENGPLWQPPPCDKRVEESGHPVRKCSEKDNSVEILLKILWMQPFSSFSDVWLTSC